MMNDNERHIPTEEELEYRNSEEFQDHDFGVWTPDGTSMLCIDPVTGERHEYNQSPEDERILLKAGYTMDDFDYLCKYSPKAQRNREEWEWRIKRDRIQAQRENKYNKEHKWSLRIANVVSIILLVIFFIPLLVITLIDTIHSNIVTESLTWIFHYIAGTPYRIIGQEALEYHYKIEPCPWKK